MDNGHASTLTLQVGEDVTLETVKRKIDEHQRVQASLSESSPVLHQTLDKGRQLAQNVHCAALDSDITNLSGDLVKINIDNAAEIKR